MTYRVFIKPSAEKEFLALPRPFQDRFRAKWKGFEVNPRPHGCKKLHQTDKYRVRIGDYRMIYSIVDLSGHVVILSIGNRKDVYR